MATPSELQQIANGNLIQLPAGAGGIGAGSLIMPITNVSAYKYIYFTLIGTPTGAGAVQVQQSNQDLLTPLDITLPRRISVEPTAAPAAIGATPAGSYYVAVRAAYARIIVTTLYTGGGLTGLIYGLTDT